MQLLSNMQQGTPEWLDFRKERIGASDAASIMGVGFNTPFRLWQIKLGMFEVIQTPAMSRGHELEPMIRDEYMLETGIVVEPDIIVHPTIPYMMASLDGHNKEKKVAVEIKTANLKYHEMAINGEIPDKYYPQLQHQLACLSYKSIHYYSYHDGNFALVEVQRDDEYIKELYIAEANFYRCMNDLIPPDLTDGDYTERLDAWWLSKAKEWQEANDTAKMFSAKCDSIKKELVAQCNGRSTKGGGVALRHFPQSKGTVSYKSIPQLKGVDLEPYRGCKKEYWRLSSD